MKKILIAFAAVMCFCGTAKAQWVVTDPTNLAQGIINATKNIIQTSSTASNMLNNFKETIKIYEQGKEYYDKLRSIKNLVKDARKVRDTYLLIGEISDIYVNNFKKMLSDRYFTVEELSAIAGGYAKLIQEATYMLQDLTKVITQNGYDMNDKERIDIIDRVYSDVLTFRNMTKYYTKKSISVSMLRAKDAGDLERVAALYGSAEDRYW